MTTIAEKKQEIEDLIRSQAEAILRTRRDVVESAELADEMVAQLGSGLTTPENYHRHAVFYGRQRAIVRGLSASDCIFHDIDDLTSGVKFDDSHLFTLPAVSQFGVSVSDADGNDPVDWHPDECYLTKHTADDVLADRFADAAAFASPSISEDAEELALVGTAPGTSSEWAAGTAYQIEALAVPTTPNGFFYKAVVAGDSAASEPTWPTVVGATVTDNEVVWRCEGKVVGQWSGSTTYGIGDFVYPETPNGFYFQARPDKPIEATNAGTPDRQVLAAATLRAATAGTPVARVGDWVVLSGSPLALLIPIHFRPAAGSNRLLLISIAVDGDFRVRAVTFGGQNCARVARAGGATGASVDLYAIGEEGLASAADERFRVAYTTDPPSGSAGAVAVAVFTGVDQDTPTPFRSTASGSADPIAASLVGEANAMHLAVVWAAGNTSSTLSWNSPWSGVVSESGIGSVSGSFAVAESDHTIGDSGSSEPTWPSSIGSEVADGDVTWAAFGRTTIVKQTGLEPVDGTMAVHLNGSEIAHASRNGDVGATDEARADAASDPGAQAMMAATLRSDGNAVPSILSAWTAGTSHTTSAGTNRLLLVVVAGKTTGREFFVDTVTYGGQAMSRLVGKAHNDGSATVRVDVWYLLDAGVAAAGSDTIAVTARGDALEGGDVAVAAGGFENVDQAAPFVDHATAGVDGQTAITADTVFLADSLGVAAVASGDDAVTYSWPVWSERLDDAFASQSIRLSVADRSGVDVPHTGTLSGQDLDLTMLAPALLGDTVTVLYDGIVGEGSWSSTYEQAGFGISESAYGSASQFTLRSLVLDAAVSEAPNILAATDIRRKRDHSVVGTAVVVVEGMELDPSWDHLNDDPEEATAVPDSEYKLLLGSYSPTVDSDVTTSADPANVSTGRQEGSSFPDVEANPFFPYTEGTYTGTDAYLGNYVKVDDQGDFQWAVYTGIRFAYGTQPTTAQAEASAPDANQRNPDTFRPGIQAVIDQGTGGTNPVPDDTGVYPSSGSVDGETSTVYRLDDQPADGGAIIDPDRVEEYVFQWDADLLQWNETSHALFPCLWNDLQDLKVAADGLDFVKAQCVKIGNLGNFQNTIDTDRWDGGSGVDPTFFSDTNTFETALDAQLAYHDTSVYHPIDDRPSAYDLTDFNALQSAASAYKTDVDNRVADLDEVLGDPGSAGGGLDYAKAIYDSANAAVRKTTGFLREVLAGMNSVTGIYDTITLNQTKHSEYP